MIDIGVDASADKFVQHGESQQCPVGRPLRTLDHHYDACQRSADALEAANLRQHIQGDSGWCGGNARVGSTDRRWGDHAVDAATGAQLCKDLLAELIG